MLGMRRCGNLRCANVAGASEADLLIRTCASCLTFLYCSAACQRADWRRHKGGSRLCLLRTMPPRRKLSSPAAPSFACRGQPLIVCNRVPLCRAACAMPALLHKIL